MKIVKCERGSGNIISTVMFLIIAALFLSGTFLWQVKSQDQINMLDDNRMAEAYVVTPTFFFDKEEDVYTAIVKVENVGPIEIKLVQMWIIDESNNDHKNIDISYVLGVDDSADISEIGDLISGLDNSFDLYSTTYYIKVVTSRGNVASSRLMHRAEMDGDSNWPIIIDSDTSWVMAVGSQGHIHLEAWNRLDTEIMISLVVATKMGKGAEQSEIIRVTWALESNRVTVGDFWGDLGEVYLKGKTVFIELASDEGIVIGSCYFVVRD